MATQPNMMMTMAPPPAPASTAAPPAGPAPATSPLAKAADFDFAKEAGQMQGASSWTPSQNAMASNQLSKLLASDSKLMTQARSMAARSSARRGLLNSSIGVEAGESAAIQSAVPIAQQDAGTFARAEEFSANANNQFAMDANRYGRESALTKYQGILAREAQERDQGWRSGENVLDRTQQLTMQDRDFGFRRGESALDRQFQSTERQADRTFQRDERISTQQYQSGENALQRAFQTGERIGNQDFQAAQAVLDRAQQLRIQQLQEQGMDTRQATQIAAQERAQKADQVFTAEQRAVDRQFQTSERVSQQQFQAGESALDRAFRTGERVSQQDFAAAQAVLDRNQQLRVQELQERGMDTRQATQIAAQERDAAANRAFSAEQAAVDRQFRGEQAGLDRAQQTNMQTQQQQFQAAQAGLDRQQQATLQANSQEWQAAQNKLSQQFQMDFEKFRLPMNMMASFSERMQGFVTQVMSDPNLTPEARDGAIRNYQAYSQQTMGWMANFFGQSMPNMATGGTITPAGQAPAPGTPAAPAPATPVLPPAPAPVGPNVPTPSVGGNGGSGGSAGMGFSNGRPTSVFESTGDQYERFQMRER